MAKKSRYQKINRGRKGRPCWVIHNSVTGQDIYVGNKGVSDTLSLYRRVERDFDIPREKLVAEGYHLPGLKEF